MTRATADVPDAWRLKPPRRWWSWPASLLWTPVSPGFVAEPILLPGHPGDRDRTGRSSRTGAWPGAHPIDTTRELAESIAEATEVCLTAQNPVAQKTSRPNEPPLRRIPCVTSKTLPTWDARRRGGRRKGRQHGEMVKAQLPVPPGFVVLRDSYLISMSSAGVSDELNAAHREAMLHAGDPGRFEEMCANMKALVIKAGMADEVRERILTAYRAIGSNPYVAVRSSATGGRWRRRLLRRHERDLHQHPRRTGSDRRCAELLGFSVRASGGRLPGQPRI